MKSTTPRTGRRRLRRPGVGGAAGAESPVLTPYLNNMGSSLSELGCHAGALDCFRRSLALTEKQLGPEHPLLLLPLTGLGEAYLGLGDHKHAIDQLGAL
jgi:Tetratricopeptide repeat